MRLRARKAFAGAAACFALFCANVAAGALGEGAFLRDLYEMLILLAAVLLFVVGILAREAAAVRTKQAGLAQPDKSKGGTHA